MKELESHSKFKAEVHQEQNQKVEYKFIGSCFIKNGCKLYSYDSEKDEMKEVAVSKKASINLNKEVVNNKESQHNPKFLYFQAINEKNARRKLKKYKDGDYSVAESFEEREFEKLIKF